MKSLSDEETHVLMLLRAITGLYDSEDVEDNIKSFILKKLKTKNHTTITAVTNVVKNHFPQYNGMLDKYKILI